MMSCAITFLGTPVKRTLQSVEEPPAKQDTAEDYQHVFLFVCFFYDHFPGKVIIHAALVLMQELHQGVSNLHSEQPTYPRNTECNQKSGRVYGEGDIAGDFQAVLCEHIGGKGAGGHVMGKFNI